MKWELIYGHYSKTEVKSEIASYCLNRWIALHCEEKDAKGLPLMIRYEKLRRCPLKISSENDVMKIINECKRYRPRAFYATAHIYKKINSIEDVMDRSNIIASSPTWDIDSKDGDWRKVVEKALEIIDVLEKNGVVRSVFFKWSGRGAHVHVNPNAFSKEIYMKIDPLDIAYSVTQYVANRVSLTEGVVVENKIDIQRVFTAPLSLHRLVDRVAVCIPPEKLSEFHIDWTRPDSFKHFPDSWRRFAVGEGDALAERAFFAIGPYIVRRSRRRKHKPLDQEILETLRKFDERI